MENSKKKHWETVYETKNPDQVSWTQEIPKTSLNLIHSFNLSKSAKIIDIGGGDSKLVDFLLEEGFENITVLDISQRAIEKAQLRLGSKANKINWIVSDITQFIPTSQYDIWHDRAAFHFLTSENDIDKYVEIVKNSVSKYIIIGTFSENGPQKCSGLEIKQYSQETLTKLFQKDFQIIECFTEDHTTPFDTKQNFIYCSFKKMN
jgi:SAM-dependent methyltransferase